MNLLSAEEAALRNPSATWYWGLCGYVCIDSGGRLIGAGDKTQICHSLCGAKNKAPAMIRTKKDALADAYANNGAVPARLGPVGSSAYTPQGTAHDWLYTSLEDAGRGGRTCEMDVGGRALRLREMNWRESKGPTKWPWTWRATVAGGSHTPGVYLIVADQRAVQLSGGGKPYLMRMVGTLYPVAISPDAPPAALEVAARDRLRTLGRQGKSGGTDALAGYGSVRVDGM